MRIDENGYGGYALELNDKTVYHISESYDDKGLCYQVRKDSLDNTPIKTVYNFKEAIDYCFELSY